MIKPFKTCSLCAKNWPTREGFLDDGQIRVIGYQAGLDDPDQGAFLFNHEMENCGTTMALRAHLFMDLYDGPVYEKALTHSEDCPGYCLAESNLEACPAQCACAHIRQVLQVVKNWPASTPASA